MPQCMLLNHFLGVHQFRSMNGSFTLFRTFDISLLALPAHWNRGNLHKLDNRVTITKTIFGQKTELHKGLMLAIASLSRDKPDEAERVDQAGWIDPCMPWATSSSTFVEQVGGGWIWASAICLVSTATTCRHTNSFHIYRYCTIATVLWTHFHEPCDALPVTMRLIEILQNGVFRLTRNLRDDAIPRYAILSHTWGDETDKVTFKDMVGASGQSKAGYRKIVFCS